MYFVLQPIIHYALLIIILISSLGIFYRALRERPLKRWLRAFIFAVIAFIITTLIDKNTSGLIAFIGFYSFVIAVLSFILSFYFVIKRKIQNNKHWAIVCGICIVLMIVSFAFTGTI